MLIEFLGLAHHLFTNIKSLPDKPSLKSNILIFGFLLPLYCKPTFANCINITGQRNNKRLSQLNDGKSIT